MTKLTELERLVAVETKLDTVIETLKTTNEKLDVFLPTFVTHSTLTEKLNEVDKKVDSALKEKKSRAVVRDVLIVMLTSTVTFLLFFFLNSLI
ncbi:hypothetical protein [Caudoviricetes sp.]|nr:hypothetical protein [Caudoviricetes sp.]